MAKFSDILLTVDFDRTLTAPDSSIPQRNLEAIEYFMANGGAFTVNTGRSIPMYSALLDVVPVNAPVLLYNGSAAYDKDTGELTFATPIDLDWRETIRKVQEMLPDLMVEIQGIKAHYTFSPNGMWEKFNIHNNCPWGYASFDDDLGQFLKFSVYGEFREPTVDHLYQGSPEELARIEDAAQLIERTFAGKVQVFRSAGRLLDIHAAGVSKGVSARQLQKQLGRKHLVCVGDAPNDLQMLLEADYAYCPADATLADRFENVCKCADGAVADVIYKKIPEIME